MGPRCGHTATASTGASTRGLAFLPSANSKHRCKPPSALGPGTTVRESGRHSAPEGPSQLEDTAPYGSQPTAMQGVGRERGRGCMPQLQTRERRGGDTQETVPTGRGGGWRCPPHRGEAGSSLGLPGSRFFSPGCPSSYTAVTPGPLLQAAPRVLPAAHCLFVTDVTSGCPARPGARLAGYSAWSRHRLHQPRAARATLTRGKPRLGVTDPRGNGVSAVGTRHARPRA